MAQIGWQLRQRFLRRGLLLLDELLDVLELRVQRIDCALVVSIVQEIDAAANP
jgi:hypothetical protein